MKETISKSCKDENLSLKVKLEEDKCKEEVLQDLIQEWEENCQSLEVECVSLRKDLEGIKTEKGLNENFTKGTRKLDKRLNSQRPSRIKTSLG